MLCSQVAPLHHKNLVYMLGACWDGGPEKLCLVLEYCENGSLAEMLDAGTPNRTWIHRRYGVVLEVAQCLRYLHHFLKHPLAHRDVKPENVLLDSDFAAKLADFGESKFIEYGADPEEAVSMTVDLGAGTRMHVQ